MNTRTAMPSAQLPDDVVRLAGKYLTFRLANEEYGIEIVKVQEIIGMLPVAKLPLVPDYVRGVVNLRGRIIPTIDLRTKFGMAGTPDTEKTCIIVVGMKGSDALHHFGIVVDEVAEVMNVGPQQVNAAPDFGASLNAHFIRRVGLVNGGVKILLDIDHVLSGAALESIQGGVQGRLPS